MHTVYPTHVVGRKAVPRVDIGDDPSPESVNSVQAMFLVTRGERIPRTCASKIGGAGLGRRGARVCGPY